LAYAAYSDNWVIVLDYKTRRHIICGYAFGLNSDAASASANDKVATYCLLAASNLPAIPHYLLSTIVDTDINRPLLGTLMARYSDMVIKPLRGSRGELVARFTDVEAACAFAHTSGEREWTASPFIDIQTEMRFVVFNGEVRLVYEKINPVIKDNHLKLFNLSQGTGARLLPADETPPGLERLAVQAMAALSLRLGAVDIIRDSAGAYSVLEVNSHFSLDHFAETSADNRQRVLDFYVMLIGQHFNLHSN
jgi:glutathione synthase/RimK-type ligase-like ATP-grasp enzyme